MGHSSFHRRHGSFTGAANFGTARLKKHSARFKVSLEQPAQAKECELTQSKTTMKMKLKLAAAALLCSTLHFPLSTARAQNYTVDWYKISGGGGTSTGGTYSVSGTIGQHDAGGPMSGGNYSLTGGFWSIISLVQSAGVPKLMILPNGPNSVKVLWPDPATNGYTLQQNSNLANGAWTTSGYSITSANGTNSITITPPAGNLFFRLKQ